MCYARRQRLSWARIKLSFKVWSWLLSFFVWFTQSNSLYFFVVFYIFFWGSMSLSRNDYYIIPRSLYLVKSFFNFFIKNLLFRLFVWSSIEYIIHYSFSLVKFFWKFIFHIWLASLTVPLYNTRIFLLCQIFFEIFFNFKRALFFKHFSFYFCLLGSVCFYFFNFFIFLVIFLILLVFLCKRPWLFGVNLFWSCLLQLLLILLLGICFFLLLRS